MGKKNLKILGVILIFLFTLNIFTGIINLGIIPANNQKKLENAPILDIKDEEIITEKPINKESPKTANSAEFYSNFTFNTSVEERWKEEFIFLDINSSKDNENETEWMKIKRVKGAYMDYELNMVNLQNLTSYQYMYPSNFTTMKLSFLNESYEREELGVIRENDDKNVGKGNFTGQMQINETDDVSFIVWNDWLEDTNISFSVIFDFEANRNYTVETQFIPTIENTDMDYLTWELNIEGHGDLTTQLVPSNCYEYDSTLEILALQNFTIRQALGYDGHSWAPIDYTRDATHIYFNEPFQEYRIELTTPNYISIVYNDNLTFRDGKNELDLYVTCKMNGTLKIQFELTNGTILEPEPQDVVKDEIVYFNHIMEINATGGIGSLNVTLTNGSRTQFGVKMGEVTFFKQCQLWGMTSNTSAFSQFFVVMAYLDLDYLGYLSYLNYTGEINITIWEMFNMTVVPNATVTYELGDFQGELTCQLLGRWYSAPNCTLYWDVLDLSSYQIVPGEYNLTYRASRLGYQTKEFETPFIIDPKAVNISIKSVNKFVAIEEEFLIVLELSENDTKQPYLWTPVTLNITFTYIKTGEIAVQAQWWQPAIQAITIQDVIGNDTLPGDYNLTITIDSEYYYGEASWIMHILKKVLDISVDYDANIRAGADTNFSWSLENNDFQGNRVNMSLQIILDNQLYREYNLTSNSTGWKIMNFASGTHNITYRLISPFYEAETTVIIKTITSSLPIADDDDDDGGKDKEENILFWFIIIGILIAVSILAVFLLISRHKVKAQRELDSELVALKTKTTASEQKISLIEAQISEIASIYWIIIVHSEQGTTMIEISDFRFGEVLDEKYKHLIGKGMMRDSALIGGFLTAIRNFSRETSDTSLEYQPVFNSQTDYSTIVDDNEIHRRILEGTNYFMAFVSSRGTIEISDVLSSVNTLFQEEYGEMVEKFSGAVSPFRPFEEKVVEFLHNEIRELQKKLKEEELLLGQFEGHLKEVQEKIGIKPKKSADLDYK